MRDCVFELLVDVKRDAIAKFDATKDVQAAFDAITTVVHMSQVARKEGLLALEEEFASYSLPQNASISEMVLLVVDGVAPEIIAEILTNGYWANKYEDNEALEQYILMRGTLLVQDGVNPIKIQQILMSLLPKSFHATCAEYIESMEAVWQKESDAKVLEQFKNWKRIEVENEIIKAHVRRAEELVLKLHDFAIQRVMREADNTDLTMCAAVFSDKGRDFILKNMSSRLRVLVIRDLLHISAWSSLYKEDDILSSVETVETIIRRLEASGEIIVIEQ